jgi:hypothetical protein
MAKDNREWTVWRVVLRSVRWRDQAQDRATKAK